MANLDKSTEVPSVSEAASTKDVVGGQFINTHVGIKLKDFLVLIAAIWAFSVVVLWHWPHWFIVETYSETAQGWIFGDWLSNYSGGFVRRGLSGTIFLWLPMDGAGLLSAVAIGQALLLGAFLVLVTWLYFLTSRTEAWLCLMLSPAFVLFFGLNKELMVRKELLGTVIVAAVALAVRRGAQPWIPIVLTLLLPVSGLVHETNALLFPTAFTLIWAIRRRGMISRKQYFGVVAPLTLGSLLVLVVSAVFNGGLAQSATMCGALVNRGLNDLICTGPMEVLAGNSLSDALSATASLATIHLTYIPLTALALIPFVFLGLNRVLWVAIVIQAIAIGPLFIVGTDYGRWIWLLVASAALLVLAMSNTSYVRPFRVPIAFVFIYAVAWSLPFKSDDSGLVASNGLLQRWAGSGLKALVFFFT